MSGDEKDKHTQFKPPDPDFEARVRDSFARQKFMDLLEARLTEVSPGFCEIQCDFRPELTQQHGFFHAGVTGSIVDSACGYAAFTLMAPGTSVLTVEYKLNLMAPALGELLIARGEVIRPGKTLMVTRGDVYIKRGHKQKLCASSLSTIMLMKDMSDE